MIEAIIFDCDGVILDNENLWDAGQIEFLGRRGFVYDREKTKHLLTGRSLSEGAKVMQEQYGFEGDPEILATERFQIMEKLYHRVEFVPGFLEFYEKIKSDYKTAVATSSRPELFSIANKKLGISKLFGHHIYFLKDVDFKSKPNPDLFLHAAKMINCAPENCLVIEDAPLGVEAAQRAGMKCIGLSITHGREHLKQADQLVDSFEQINLEKFNE